MTPVERATFANAAHEQFKNKESAAMDLAKKH